MKLVYAILSVFTNLTVSSCFVTERTRHTDLIETTLIPALNDTQNIILKEGDKKLSKNVPTKETTVYLEDVMFNLKNHEWSADQKPCLDQIYSMLYNLQNFTLWAVWDWDAISSEPQGLLFGNKYQLGNYDQCMKAPWSTTHPHLRTKYCLAEVVLERTDKAVRRRVDDRFHPYKSALDFIQYHPPHYRTINELTWGVCVPSGCAPQTVERLLGIVLARSHLGAAGMKSNISINEECQTSEDQMPYDELFYAFFIFMGSMAFVCLICTYLNSQTEESDPETTKSAIVKSFCIKKNANDLLTMKKDGIEVFYGIRYLTICLIVLDHQVGILNAGPVSDGIAFDQALFSTVGLLVLHDDLFVDTFFLISGFLTITYLLKLKRIPYIVILKRYIRLIVPYAVVIFFICAVFPYMGSGPLWNRAVSQDTDQCRKNWWLNLLMVNNYVDTENICLVISWYIPCDFHFFIVTIIALSLYKKWPKLGVVVAAILTTAAVASPAIVNYIYQLPAVQSFTIEFVTNPRGAEDFRKTYITSHTRYASYLVGVCSGWIYVKFRAKGNISQLKQKWSFLGACSALTLMLAVMMYGSTFIRRNYGPIEGALYAAFNRPIWACGVVILVFCCSFGNVPIIKSFLSWYPWAPLSRLSYGLYLTHTLLISRNIFSTRNPRHNDHFETVSMTIGVIVWGTIAALILWLLFEAPANNLFALCLKPKTHDQSTSNKEVKPSDAIAAENTSPVPTSSSGHLSSNLPSTVNYSSKI